MSEDNITVKVSGTAVYKAVKQYLDNSPTVQKQIAEAVEKVLGPAIQNRVNGMLSQLDADIRFSTRKELDATIKKEVETRIAQHIQKGIAKMFEGS